MAWIIQSMCDGPLILSEIGLNLTKGQYRDLDLIGRENAERSNDIKLALQKDWIRTVRKDPHTESRGLSSEIIQTIQESSAKANEAAGAAVRVAEKQSEIIVQLEGRNAMLEKQLGEQKAQTEDVLNTTKKVLEEVKAFADRHPLELRTIKEAIQNIQIDRDAILAKRQALKDEGLSEAEIAAQEKILSLKDKKLEKNADKLGKTVASSAEDVGDALKAMEELGLE